MTAVTGEAVVVRDRASAYDQIYAGWQVKRVTIDSYEEANRYFLNATGRSGHMNGNEIEHALKLLDADHLAGRRVLDYCCGAGRTSIYFALKGAEVSAFDASAQAVRVAAASAEMSGVADRIAFGVMNAANLAYPDDFFDAVFCQSALHIIIDYPGCAEEIARVLKPGGKAIFCEEPLGHNPLLEPIRWLRRRKYSGCGGRTLRYADLYRFGKPFVETRIHHFNLFTQVKVFAGSRCRSPVIKPVLQVFDRVDRGLLASLPFMRPLAGKVVVEYVA